MRDPKLIELELDRTRDDLEASLSELKDVLAEKLDIKKHAAEAIDHAVDQAKARVEHAVQAAKHSVVDAAVGAKDTVVEVAAGAKDNVVHAATYVKDETVDLYQVVKRLARERPGLFVAVIGGAVAAVTLTVLVRRRYAA